jgi:hypothetical protein
MKLIEKMAQAYWLENDTEDSVTAAYMAGFRACMDLIVNRYGDGFSDGCGCCAGFTLKEKLKFDEKREVDEAD